MKHPDYLDLDSRQIAEWMAYYMVEPWGGVLERVQTARLTHVVVSALFKEGSSIPVEDFMPRTPFQIMTGEGEGAREQTPDDHAAIIEAMFGHLRAQEES